MRIRFLFEIIMADYYSDKLSAERLKRCYDIAPPRIRQYFEAELEFVLSHLTSESSIIELGCGYGRVLEAFRLRASEVVGIDTSFSSLLLAREKLNPFSNIYLAQMNAIALGLSDNYFDCTVCIQNGISAFGVNRSNLMAEAVRITKPGGTVLFSTYSENIWDQRLYWFELQSQTGLLGEIDYDATGDGNIVCKDGFKATTITPEQFAGMVKELNLKAEIIEIDCSSLFCKISV